ncbi:hypothetical protein EGT49_08620 [Companilactobacillus suantsaicola]|uniref:Uncharacterized protein n=2 Tax=Companilactobacillus suantsaicola TaxID=2487723 RepID=A0A4Z0JJW2_9LACO|nr:hypothetical protein EGT49_08620 [Companilactobacillus suantsaicola]
MEGEILMTQQVPEVKSVSLLPNFNLCVTYDNGEVRFADSEYKNMEMHVFDRANLGATNLTPGWYWIGPEIKLSDNNHFTVNGGDYDGNAIYQSDSKED